MDFSIDLGIDPAATQDNLGTLDSPYTMQMSLSWGVIEENNFIPHGLSSWFMFRSSSFEQQADRLVVRVFNLNAKHSLEKPSQFELRLRHLDGTLADDLQWGAVQTAHHCDMETLKRSLGYQLPNGDCEYDCYKPMDANGHLLIYHLHPSISSNPSDPLAPPAKQTRFLLTAWVKAKLFNEQHSDGMEFYFRSDPEIVVSPYGDG